MEMEQPVRSGEKCIGSIEKCYTEMHFEWKIDDFSASNDDNYLWYRSSIFPFASTSWCLYLSPKSELRYESEFMKLYLCYGKTFNGGYIVEYYIGIEKLNGNTEELARGVLKKDKVRAIACNLKLPELERKKFEPATTGVITIMCTLKLVTIPLKKPKVENLTKLDTLSENLKSLFLNKDSCDTTLYVQGKECKAHKIILIARSCVFAAMFLHDTSEKQMGIVTIPDCDPEAFELFLKFLYCGKVEKPSFDNAFHMYKISDKYEVDDAKKFCAEYLMENLTAENVSDVAILADNYYERDLLNAAQNFFNKNFNKILQTSEWDNLVKNNYRLSKRLLTKMSLKIKLDD